MISFCREHNLILKVILEVVAIPSLAKLYEISSQVIKLGCDFLKTSTGKLPEQASTDHIATLLKAIKDSNTQCGIKIAGGIKDFNQAKKMILLAQKIVQRTVNKQWFRIGSSQLLENMIGNKKIKFQET